ISYQVDTHSEATPRLVDMGDLSTFTGLLDVSGEHTTIRSSDVKLGNAIDVTFFNLHKQSGK
ncbi:MAG TPA: hypothetical protein VL633_04430, partial [Bacteroidota bacterium]|nr:hypothetical protein [Bacteroidota bacterium]